MPTPNSIFNTPIGTIKRAAPKATRIIQVPDETPEAKMKFRSSEKDFEQASAFINEGAPANIDNEPEIYHENVEVSSADIRRKMAEFSNRPLPEGAKLLSSQDFNEYQKLKEQSKEKEKQLTPSNKERIQAILGIGRKRDFVEVENNKFWLKTLKDKETKIVMSWLLEGYKEGKWKNDAEYAKDQQLINLSFAFEKIEFADNTEITFSNLVLESFNEDTLETRLATLTEFDFEHVISVLYKKFVEMKSNVTIKSKEEAQQVVDDIKK